MKYANKYDELIGTNEHLHDVQGGDVSAPTGWYASVTLTTHEDGQMTVEHYAGPDVSSAYLIVQEDNDGFVSVTHYEDEDSRDARFDALEQVYGMWSAGVSDHEVRAAIDGYTQAAEHTVDLEGRGLSWSAEAQRQIHDDVIEFIIQNHDDIEDWKDATGHEWLQVGIDFCFTRNRESAGFWSRDKAGAAGEALTETAEVWGRQQYIVGESGEIEVIAPTLGQGGNGND